MNEQPLISVIAPMYNEEDVIAAFIERLQNVMKKHFNSYEIVLVDDGSRDKTYEIAQSLADKNPHIRILAFTRNYGHEMALTAGLEHAHGEYVVQMDSDLQHPPELIPELTTKAMSGYDIVYAARKDRRHETWLKRFTSESFYKIARKMTGLDLPSDAGNFRIINHKVVSSMRQLKENNRHLLMLYAYVGYKVTSIPFEPEARFAGKSKYNYFKLVNLALDSIISFSHRPLRYMSVISLLITILMMGYAGFLLIQRLFYEQHLADGFLSLLLMTSVLFAVLFLFLAIISEYIGRILTESKNRPLYYIREEYKKDASL
ncbi:MAG: glycosyltransferase family 2 protein [Gammaproteobacteria bacterium]